LGGYKSAGPRWGVRGQPRSFKGENRRKLETEEDGKGKGSRQGKGASHQRKNRPQTSRSTTRGTSTIQEEGKGAKKDIEKKKQRGGGGEKKKERKKIGQ